jgi:hypothetical protein
MGATRNRVLACIAAVTLVGGTVVAITSGTTAHAATTQCGTACEDLYNQQNGTADIPNVQSGPTAAGLGVRLAAAADISTEDFKARAYGPLSVFYQAGLVSAAVEQAWGNDDTYEYQYAPDGTDSGLCLGLATAPLPGEPVTLESCGVSVATVWIALSADQIGGYQPLVNASTSAINDPYVLSSHNILYRSRGVVLIFLMVNQLSLVDGAFSPSQMWNDEIGAVGHPVLP